ncbi:MAG: DUF2314 domain-containing protein [Candidatus Sumerlaeaceae bacterium]|nr:DUF2314 domain-containing protein [Candidatus Sumerlaeaceae bacterium]
MRKILTNLALAVASTTTISAAYAADNATAKANPITTTSISAKASKTAKGAKPPKAAHEISIGDSDFFEKSETARSSPATDSTSAQTGDSEQSETVEAPDMIAATQEARNTVHVFIRQFQGRKPDEKYLVKKEIPGVLSNGNKVYLWILVTEYKNNTFGGTVDKAPAGLGTTRVGDQGSVSVDNIADWVIMGKDSVQGGYTGQALLRRQKASQGSTPSRPNIP